MIFNDILFGGSFNPITNAHVEVIKLATEWFDNDIDQFSIYVTPSIKHAFGKKSIDFDKRLKWLHMALDGIDGVVIDDEGMGKYAIDYIKEARKLYDRDIRMNILIGSDIVPELLKWNEWNKLNRHHFLIVQRGNKLPDLTHIKKYDIIGKVSGGVSSSLVRRRAKRGASIDGLVPECIKNDVIKTYVKKGE